MSEFLLGFCTAEDYDYNTSTMIDLLVYNIARSSYIANHKNNKTAVFGRKSGGRGLFYLPVYSSAKYSSAGIIAASN